MLISTKIAVSNKEIIFGISNPFKLKIIRQLNYIILVAKDYIYTQKKKEKDLILINFVNHLDTEFNKKINIAKFQGKLMKIFKEWTELNDTFGYYP